MSLFAIVRKGLRSAIVVVIVIIIIIIIIIISIILNVSITVSTDVQIRSKRVSNGHYRALNIIFQSFTNI
jgi:hypothetical protein